MNLCKSGPWCGWGSHIKRFYSNSRVYVFTHADDSRGSKAFIRVCVCVCVILSVCPQLNSKTYDPQVFKLGVGNDLGESYK